MFACSKRGLLLGVSLCALTCGEAVLAQEVQTSDELVVYGTVVTRNRVDTTAPKLSYYLEFFQRFEPFRRVTR
jgi:hypothetical protein